MKKIVIIALFAICISANAHDNPRMWRSLSSTGSCISFNKKLKDVYDVSQVPALSAGIGYQFGYNFNKFYLSMDARFEGSSTTKGNKMHLTYTSLSLNFGYKIINTDEDIVSAHLGTGMYESLIFCAENGNVNRMADTKVGNSIIYQGLNMFVPVGVTWKTSMSERRRWVFDLSYRFSFCTGSSNAFGSSSKIKDMPDVKLNGLSLSMGYEFSR